MIILPAIDIKDGNCVRLFKGDFSTVEKVAADYMETAKGFETAGASWIHMVDLDGAKEGRPVNQHIYEDVAAKTGLKVEVGGGIRNLETIDTYLKSGVERVILGSAALKNPQLISAAAEKFGSQCVVCAIDAKRRPEGGWTVYLNGGRIDTGKDALLWAQEAERLGAGEILLTSMDCDGQKTGYDLELTRQVSERVGIPVIASGGAGKLEHFLKAFTEGRADAVLAASLFHFGEISIPQLKQYLRENQISVRI